MSGSHDVPSMVATYKKLFVLLVSVTALGIVLTVLHMPIAVTIIISITIIIFKSKIVYDSFKDLLIGKNILFLVLSLTIFFFLMILLLPLFNHANTITGTQDLSKEIQLEQPQAKERHGH